MYFHVFLSLTVLIYLFSFSIFDMEGDGEADSVMSSNAPASATSNSNTSGPLSSMAGLLSQPQIQLSQPPSANNGKGNDQQNHNMQAVLAQIRSQKVWFCSFCVT